MTGFVNLAISDDGLLALIHIWWISNQYGFCARFTSEFQELEIFSHFTNENKIVPSKPNFELPIKDQL